MLLCLGGLTFLLAIATGGLGLYGLVHAKNVYQELEGLLCLGIAAVLWGSALITGALDIIHRTLRQGQRNHPTRQGRVGTPAARFQDE